jgi:hypothetical protein
VRGQVDSFQVGNNNFRFEIPYNYIIQFMQINSLTGSKH